VSTANERLTDREKLAKLENAPSSHLTYTGLKFLKSLKDQGQLPGVDASDHGQFRVEAGNFNSAETTTISYPFSKTVTLTLTNRPEFIYNYSIVQISSNSEWQLQRAWKSDSTGKVIEDFSVKYPVK
jgi:hypothetical protein